jgi:hypothetical protein
MTDITEFVLAHGGQKYGQREGIELINDVINKHLEYGTIMVIRSQTDGIVAVARWNRTEEDTIHILDLVVHKKYRKYMMLKYLIALGKSKMPNLKYIIYKREMKYPNRKKRIIDIDSILK